MIEATLDDPRQILAAQLNKAKGEAVAQMKAEGIEYDERMELLEEISYPKPLAELLEHAFEVYRSTNPWAADAHLSPKSVVRDMWENAMTFREFVGTYGLTRAEGAVLRYLSDAVKALRNGGADGGPHRRGHRPGRVAGRAGPPGRLLAAGRVGGADRPGPAARRAGVGPGPAAAADRQRAGVHRDGAQRAVPAGRAVGPAPLVRPRRAGLGRPAGTPSGGARSCRPTSPSTTRCAPAPTPAGRRCSIVDKAEPRLWRVRQILDDPAGDHDWGIDVEVDLDASDEEGSAVIRLVDAGRKD